VVLDRANVVVFAMDLKGPMPFAPQPYSPSAFEWGVSIGLIAATIFLFGWAARNCRCCRKRGRRRTLEGYRILCPSRR